MTNETASCGRLFGPLAGFLLASVCSAPHALGSGAVLWAVDPHQKVFRDTRPDTNAGRVVLRAARNEYESAQIAIRSDVALEEASVRCSELRRVDGQGTIGADQLVCRFVGYIPVRKNTPDADRLRVRQAPFDAPDPLLERGSLDIPPGQTQPVWITVRVPRDAPPGLYRGEVRLTSRGGQAALPLELTVDPFALSDERHLFVTNWFSASRIARAHGLELWSEPFWRVLGHYAQDMAAHRQNVVLTPWTLIDAIREPDGRLSFDYGRFDRFIRVFERAGAADRIEISHVAHFGPGGWSGSEIVLRKVVATDRETGRPVELGAEEGLGALLGDLERHLEQRGWLDKAMIHVADEPSLNNVESWRQASAAVRRWAPRLRRIDAIETIDFTGALEIWTPKLSHFDRWRSAYEARRAGNEFWYYICCHPYGNVYPNRFLDYPTSCVRVLHWINFAENLRGYLHWGLNAWGDDPFGPPRENLPPGDTHVIYPGDDGPLSSIRWEIQRESLEDFEYLWLLSSKTAAVKTRLGEAAKWLDPRRRALELCRRVVPAISETVRDPAAIMAARRAVADEIAALDRPPMLVMQTEPPEGAVVVQGPIAVELRGVTDPGAKVRVNGRSVAVRPNGEFACLTRPVGDPAAITVDAEHDGRRKTTVRRFVVRR